MRQITFNRLVLNHGYSYGKTAVVATDIVFSHLVYHPAHHVLNPKVHPALVVDSVSTRVTYGISGRESDNHRIAH